MAKLTVDEVKHVALLARLDLTPEEVTTYSTQLSQVVDYQEELNALKLDDVVPTSQPGKLENIIREDLARPELSLKDLKPFSTKKILNK